MLKARKGWKCVSSILIPFYFFYTLSFLLPTPLSTTTWFADIHTQWTSAVSNDVLVASGWLVGG